LFNGFLGDGFEDLPADEDAEDDGGEGVREWRVVSGEV
jgi:hypothetical protein